MEEPSAHGAAERGSVQRRRTRPVVPSMRRAAAVTACAVTLVVGAALLAADAGGPAELMQQQLSVGLNVAKMFEQTRADAERDESGQIPVQRARRADRAELKRREAAEKAQLEAMREKQKEINQQEKLESMIKTAVDRPQGVHVAVAPAAPAAPAAPVAAKHPGSDEDSESWGKRKLRDMVAQLFRAVAAIDKRMVHEEGQTQRIRSVTKRMQAKEVTRPDLSASQQQIEKRILAAAKQLGTVLQGERTTRSIITQQEKVDDSEHHDLTKKLSALSLQVRSLRQGLTAEKSIVAHLRAVRKEEDDDDAAVVATLSSLLQSTGVLPKLDAWCTHNGSCDAVSSEVMHGASLFARLGPGSGADAGLQWRCYAASALSADKTTVTGGAAYCTHTAGLEQQLREEIGLLEAEKHRREQQETKELGHDARKERAMGTSVAAAKSKLQIVGKDLNALDAGEAQLSADAAAAGQKQELDLHAIATLDRRDATLQQQLSAERAAVHTQFSAEEHQALIDNSNTVRAIAPKIKSVLAKEEVRSCACDCECASLRPPYHEGVLIEQNASWSRYVWQEGVASAYRVNALSDGCVRVGILPFINPLIFVSIYLCIHIRTCEHACKCTCVRTCLHACLHTCYRQTDVRGIDTTLAGMSATQASDSHALAALARTVREQDATKQVVLTLTTKPNGEITASGHSLVPSGSSLAQSKLGASIGSNMLASNARVKALKAGVGEPGSGKEISPRAKLTATTSPRGGRPMSRTSQFATVWRSSKLVEVPPVQQSAMAAGEIKPVKKASDAVTLQTVSKRGEGVTPKHGSGVQRLKKGCLIHLSGVVAGLDADNSVEC